MYIEPIRVFYTPHLGPVVVVSYGPGPLMRPLGLDTERISVPVLFERREPHGVPNPCRNSCTVCATVCPIVMSSLSNTADVLTIGRRPTEAASLFI